MFEALITKYPALSVCLPDIEKAYETLLGTFENGGRLYVCGNGGSESDAKHIVGELMKGFEKKRRVHFADGIRSELKPETAAFLEGKLQGALPAHALSGESALITALANDIEADIIYAQQIYGYGKPGDCLLCLSTSGNAVNVCLAAELAQAMGLHTVALTGSGGGKLGAVCDIAVRVPASVTADVQELHLPVYHALCRALEAHFFE